MSYMPDLPTCAENDPGSVGYVPDATGLQRAAFADRANDPNAAPSISYDHVMIDIESMSLSKHNALILSVGMIEFAPEPIDGVKFGMRSLLLPSIEQQLLLGREVSKGTQKFWRDQSTEAAAHWVNYSGERDSLARVCMLVRQFCDRAKRVWANGTQFDLSNLEGLNDQLGSDGQSEGLWHYRKPRDMRTFVAETSQTRIVPFGDASDIPGVPHEPIYDCISQAWQVWAHWQS